MSIRSGIVACALACLAGLVACGPAGGVDDLAPALLALDPLVLDFGPEVDTETLLVKNSGGETLTFSLQVSAVSDGVSWLKVSPEQGAVEGSGAMSILVTVTNRDELLPGNYSGKITVVADGLDAMTVNVNMTVGQPVLVVEPSDVIDFGADGTNRNLTIKNGGQGRLSYVIELPKGGWLSTEAVLQKEILPNEPQTIPLALLREEVPWYGKKSDFIVVTSNGLDDESHSSTLNIEVMVDESDLCEVDSNCTKTGHFCKPDEEGEGHCKPKKDAGQQCSAAGQCTTGVCSDGVCCDVVCDGPCLSCSLADSNGTCVQRPKDSPCDDGDPCTVDESCFAGECLTGDPLDCSGQDSECVTGVCDPESGECTGKTNDDACFIDGKCRSADEGHPFKDCLVCKPESTQETWSLVPGTCHIETECFEAGEALTDDGCVVCDLEHPEEPSKADEGAPCVDDDNECTDDVCEDGACTHVSNDENSCSDGDDCTQSDACVDGTCKGEAYTCETQLDCAQSMCDGDGSCQLEVEPGFCVIDGDCWATAAVKPNSGGCLRCIPSADQFDFTPEPDGGVCSDNSPCTLDDECLAGACVGQQVVCDDEVFCTADFCDLSNGQCQFEVLDEWCLIGEQCFQEGASPDGAHKTCNLCDPAQNKKDWTWANQDVPCDDLSPCSAESTCQIGQCVPSVPLCDDGLGCTEDACTEDNQCTHELLSGFCLIEGECFSGGALKMGSAGCAGCDPLQDGYKWTLAGPEQPCSDGDLCTVEDACTDGLCIGAKKNCDDGKHCTDDSCAPDSGLCVNQLQEEFCVIADKCREAGSSPLGENAACLVCNPEQNSSEWVPQNEDEACDDQSECTPASVCDDGECVAVGVPCDDFNECTDDFCTDEEQCVHTNKQEGTACQADEIGCTDDHCVGGECKHPVKDDFCYIDELCRAEGDVPADTLCLACDPAVPYKWTSVNEGLDCSDDLWCTVSDVCTDGVCAGAPRDCGGDPCNIPECNEDTDECTIVPQEQGAPCDDGDPCTIADTCDTGDCLGQDKDCSHLADGNDCLYAFCDPDSVPEPGQCAVEPYPADHPCDDGLYCMSGEKCDGGGTCAGATPRDCDTFGQCVGGYCDEDQEQCLPEPKADFEPCNADDDGCTVDDYCLDQQCKPGSLATCDHVADSCNSASCESQGPDNYSCLGEPKGEGVPCDDGKFCTDGEVCDGLGGCAGGTPKDCSGVLSGQQCKIASCNEANNICQKITAPDGWACDDNIPCTLEDECANGQCVGAMDGCSQRKLNSVTQGNDPDGFPFVPQVVSLGEGDIMTMWRSGDKAITTRIVDRELSKAWVPITASWKEDFPSGDCFNEITTASIGARSTGEWVIAMGYRWGKLTNNPFPQTDNHKVYYRISYSAFDKKMAQLKTPTDLWSGTVHDKDQNWTPKCSDLPNGGSGWPQDYITTLAFSDGAYGVLVKVQDGIPQYYPINSSFNKSSNIPLSGVSTDLMYHISGCALSNNNIGLVWYNNGYVGAGVVNRNMQWVSSADYIAQTSGNPGHQWFPRCSALPNGRWVVAFNSYHDGGPAKMYLQAYNNTGSKYGSLKTVSTGHCGHTMGPAAFPNSKFVMTWQEQSFDSSGIGIAGKGYSSNISPSTNTYPINDEESGNQFWPMQMADGYEFLAVWATKLSGPKYDWYFKRFDGDGAGKELPGAPERKGNQDTDGEQASGAAAPTFDGAVMAWESEAIDGNGAGVSFRLVDDEGVPTSPEFMANEEVIGDQFQPAVASHAGAQRVMVVWTTTNQFEGEDVMGRVFDMSGNPLGEEFRINSETTGDQNQPSAAAVSGGFVVGWTSDPGNGSDVMARTYDTGGGASGSPYLVNANGSGAQYHPIFMSQGESSSSFVAAWLEEGGSGQDGIYVRRMNKSGSGETGNMLAQSKTNIQHYSAHRHSSGTVGLCWFTSLSQCRLLNSNLGQQGAEFTVGDGSVGYPAVLVRDNSRLWVTYQSSGNDASGLGIIRDELDFSGNRTRFPILVNWFETGNQSRPFASRVEGGAAFIGWVSEGQDGAGSGIYYRVLE